MANIRQLKEGDDVTVFYPQTHLKAVIDSEGNTLDEILENLEPGGSTDAVKYTPQTLTTAQKAQARTNIDAPSTADVAAKQDTISDLSTIRSGAAAGAKAYQKPQTGIPSSDLAPGVIPTVPTDVVKYSSQSLTDAQKAQARTNIGAAAASALTALETAIAAKYTKPSNGIPETDLEANVRSALALARTSIQSPIGNGEDIDQDSEGKLQFANRAYDSQNPDGLGYVILRKDATFAEQVTAENTIYEIRYDFELGAAHTVPTGCVLRFVGGSITGAATLTFQNTVIEGDAEITCGIAGTIDGVVNVGWFGLKNNDSTFDNGAVVNKVAAVFKKIYLPVGTYYTTTPILLQNMEQLLFDGLIWYKGTTDDVAAVTLKGSNGTFVFKGRIYGYQNATINHTGDGGTNIRGLEVQNCNNSVIYVWSVKDFNECLRVSSPSPGGCSYNTFIIGELCNANRAIRIFQDNGGWANENHFIGGRIYCESNWIASGRNRYAVYIAGPGTASDTRKTVNGLSFTGMSMEGYVNQNCAIYAYGVQSSSFKQIRAEGTANPSGYFIKWVGGCKDNIVEIGYSNALGTKDFDYSEVTSFPFRRESLSANFIKRISLWDFQPDYTNGDATGYWITPDTVFNARSTTFARTHISGSFSESGGARTASNYPVCVVLDCTKVKTFYAKANKKVRFVIWYLEDTNGNTISGGDTQKNYIAPASRNGRYLYNPNVYCYNSGVDELDNEILVTDPNIAKVVIGCKGTFDEFSVFALGGVVVDEFFAALVTHGPTASRPTRRPRGFQYFDEDLVKWIMWNGSAWANLDGSALT